MSLTLDNVTRVVGPETHIYPTSLTLAPGTINVLLGPTTAGKTSLMRLMAGLDKPSSGQVHVDGRDVTGMSVRQRDVAMVYQRFINYPTVSVYENIASPLRLQNWDGAAMRERVHEVARLLRLDGLLDRTPPELSGGQQQRTALARALAKNARLVLLDEPLANLDYKLREELREELPRIFEASGAIFVYATTEPEEALLLGGRTATVDKGQVTRFGDTLDVYRTPGDLVTADVFSDPPINTLPVSWDGRRVSDGDQLDGAATGPLATLAPGDYTVAVRAQHLYLSPPHSDCLAVTGTVGVAELTGSQSFIHLDYGERRWVAVIDGVQELAVGDNVTVYFDPRRFLVFDADGQQVAGPHMAGREAA